MCSAETFFLIGSTLKKYSIKIQFISNVILVFGIKDTINECQNAVKFEIYPKWLLDGSGTPVNFTQSNECDVTINTLSALSQVFYYLILWMTPDWFNNSKMQYVYVLTPPSGRKDRQIAQNPPRSWDRALTPTVKQTPAIPLENSPSWNRNHTHPRKSQNPIPGKNNPLANLSRASSGRRR